MTPQALSQYIAANTQAAVTSQPTTALRLLKTKDLPRDDWLKARKQGLGSSDAATALGLNPYQSPLSLWLDKTQAETSSDIDPEDDSQPTYGGTVLEPIVATHYSKRTGNKVRRVNAVLQHPDPDKHFMLANLDYSVVGDADVQILECKTAGEYGAKLWRDGVPLYVLCQVQHQLAVTGKKAAHICVLICGHETRIFKVTRSESVIQHIINAERYFWECVEKDIPPEADASESAAKALQQLYPEHTPLSCVDLTEVELANELFDQLIEEKNQIEQHQSQFDLLKHRVQALMQEHERAVFQQGSVTWKKSKDSISLDIKSLLQHQPELIQQYPLQKAGSRRFNIYHD